MPINVGYFRIRQPRVSSINAITTTAPTSFGNFLVLDGFDITYIGSATKCTLYVTGTRILTLCDEDKNHPDNLNIQLQGRTVGDVAQIISNNPFYISNLITARLNDAAYLIGVDKFDLISSPYLVRYNTEKEYILDVKTRGELGTAEINTKTEEFTFRGEISRWNINEGKIHDVIGLNVPLDGKVAIGNEGVMVEFKPSFSSTAIDLENQTTFNDQELVRSLEQPMSTTIFPPAPVLVDGTLSVFINQEAAIEGRDFLIDYGDKPAIKSANKGPYNITSLNNSFKIRWDSNPIQEIIFNPGVYTTDEIVSLINAESVYFSAQTFTDEQNYKYITLIGDRGTIVHQLRIENGSANSVFGFSNLQAKRGSGIGQMHFMTYKNAEDISPTVRTDSLSVSAILTASENPFLGVDTSNFVLIEDGVTKVQGSDYLVDGAGNVNLISRVLSENLVQSVLKIDTDLFEPSYVIYRNNTPLIEGVDYSIVPQGGWITLSQSAFPGDVFSASYTNNLLGKIENEIILGKKGILRSGNVFPFSISSTNNIFKVTVSDGLEQTFVFGINSATSANSIAILINSTAVGFKCLVCNNKIELQTSDSGPNSTIKLGNGTANTVLGYEEGQSAAGTGAIGGERTLEVKNSPMDILGFTAPMNGDTIIIKNNDVTSRYKQNTLIKIFNDYYQVSSSIVEDRANLINSVTGPFTIILGTNDTFKFKVDLESEKTVVFSAGSQVTAATIVSKINSERPQTARVLRVNGVDRIQLLASSEITVGSGNSNRTIGFDEKQNDTSDSDTFIQIVGRFKTTYVSPPLYTTVEPIDFTDDPSEKMEAAENSSSIFLVGDHTLKYKPNIFVRLGGIYYYKVLASIYEDGYTEITFNNRIDLPILSDTSISYSLLPIYEEGDTHVKTSKIMYLSEPHALRKNNILLEVDLDYSISETGDIEFIEGLMFGDEFTIDYTSRRYVNYGILVKSNYSYFDFLSIGTNVKYSGVVINPDNFYVNVLHGSTLLSRTTAELTERTISNLGSGSTGFPNGSISTTENDESGVGNINYTIGDLDDKIEVSKKIFEYYDQRIKYFEDERNSINGWIVGAEDGRVSVQQIIDSAILNPPQRLFPDMNLSLAGYQDTRPIEQRTEPLRIPCLDGSNQNDLGNSSNGIESVYLQQKLTLEKNHLQAERLKLTTLKTYSTTVDTLTSSGPIGSLVGNEQIIIYAEKNIGGSLVQRQFSVNMPGPSYNSMTSSYDIPPTGSSVASAINSAFTAAFGSSTIVASGSGSCTLTASTVVVCIYIVQDHPKVGFGLDNEASIRSRHTLYTGGKTYSIAVPGNSSVHIDINNENTTRGYEESLQDDQILALEGQMEEWLGSYGQSFEEAKDERLRANISISESFQCTTESTDFQNIKTGLGIFNSIDSTIIIDARISDIDSRILEIDRRYGETANRLSAISNSLTRENLYNPRFSWIVLLADKSLGYYASREREITEELRKQRVASNNLEAVLGLENLF